ncbi:MAG: hypothetical protein ACODAQ_11645, partial [Phycisphaeraceae bacterium]
VEALPGRVAEYLGQPVGEATFDLSAAGYAYVQAGECHIPAGRAVHVMYRATGAGRSDALSLWIAPHDGRLDVAEGRLYVAAGAGAPHPLVLWRRGGLVYYLAGDGMEQVDRAAQHLREGMGQAEGAGTGAGCG